jgi:LysR family transcriptional regulator, transcriptional activator of the cysJI operon
MNLSLLKIFQDLVQTQSYSKAAARNSVTQSAVSQQIANLQKRLGCTLIERGKGGLILTAQGKRFYEGCSKILDTYDELISELQSLRQDVSGSLRLSTVYSIGLHDLPPVMKLYAKKYPQVDFHVEYRRAEQVYEDVSLDRADFGFVAFPEKRARLEVKSFRQDRLVVICHPHHVLAQSSKVPLKQLAGEKFLGFDPDAPTQEALARVFKKHRVSMEHGMDFDNIETLKRAVEIDMGIAMVPLSTVTQELQNKTLRVLEIADEEIVRPLGVISRKGSVPSPAHEAFLEILNTFPK